MLLIASVTSVWLVDVVVDAVPRRSTIEPMTPATSDADGIPSFAESSTGPRDVPAGNASRAIKSAIVEPIPPRMATPITPSNPRLSKTRDAPANGDPRG
jgi:hypothetical protein